MREWNGTLTQWMGKTMGCVAREAEGSVQRTGVEAYRSVLGQVRGYAGKPPK